MYAKRPAFASFGTGPIGTLRHFDSLLLRRPKKRRNRNHLAEAQIVLDNGSAEGAKDLDAGGSRSQTVILKRGFAIRTQHVL
jgi:hypothetical protein